MAMPYFLSLLAALKKSVRQVIVIILTLSWASLCMAEVTQIAITDIGEINAEDPGHFFVRVLTLALDKTRATHGDYVLVSKKHGGGIARDRAMLVTGAGLDLMWGSATKDRLEQMRVVPIDLLKGYNNYRILLINKDAQPQFSRVKTLDDLKNFTVGSGEHWTDGMIMKDNGFKVTTTPNYVGLFKMLSARRFNFISRGLNEVTHDIEVYKGYDITPESSLLLVYDNPIKYCFFVNKNNPELANRVELGLKIAQQDGSFDEMFYQVPSFKVGEELLKSSHRQLITLKNTRNN